MFCNARFYFSAPDLSFFILLLLLDLYLNTVHKYQSKHNYRSLLQSHICNPSSHICHNILTQWIIQRLPSTFTEPYIFIQRTAALFLLTHLSCNYQDSPIQSSTYHTDITVIISTHQSTHCRYISSQQITVSSSFLLP